MSHFTSIFLLKREPKTSLTSIQIHHYMFYITTRIKKKTLKIIKQTNFEIHPLFQRFSGYDHISFIIYKTDKPEIEENCYVRVFCKYDFTLYNYNQPEQLYPLSENLRAVFDNFSVTTRTNALPLKKTIVNYKPAFWLSDSIFEDDSIKQEIVDEFNKVDLNHYSFQGEHIDLDEFIFNEEMIRLRKKYSCYVINDRKSGKEYIAYVSQLPISMVSSTFSEELLICRTVKFPSILLFKGYNEANFYHFVLLF